MKKFLLLVLIVQTFAASAQIEEFDITLNVKGWVNKRSFLLDTAHIPTSKRYLAFMPGVEIFTGPRSSFKIMYSFAAQREVYVDTTFKIPYLDAYKKSFLHGIVIEGRKYFFAGKFQPFLNLPLGLQFSKTQFDLQNDGSFNQILKSIYLQVSPELGISWRILPILRISAAYSPYTFSYPLSGENKKLTTLQNNQLNLGAGLILYRRKDKDSKK